MQCILTETHRFIHIEHGLRMAFVHKLRALKAKLLRSLPHRSCLRCPKWPWFNICRDALLGAKEFECRGYKVDVEITPGTHNTEDQAQVCNYQAFDNAQGAQEVLNELSSWGRDEQIF